MPSKLVSLFVEFDKHILKYVWKCKESKIAKTLKNKVGRFAFSDKAIIFETV